jgi:hypothetical protein
MQTKRRTSKRPTPNYQSFYIEIEDWEPSYSFALEESKYREGPYWEHLELTITGLLLSPQRVKDCDVKLVLLASREDRRVLEQSPSEDWKPLNVGVLPCVASKETSWGHCQAMQHGALCMRSHAEAFVSYTFMASWPAGVVMFGGSIFPAKSIRRI